MSSYVADTLGPTRTQVPFEALRDTLNVEEEVLKRIMHSLSCGKYQVARILVVNDTATASRASLHFHSVVVVVVFVVVVVVVVLVVVVTVLLIFRFCF